MHDGELIVLVLSINIVTAQILDAWFCCYLFTERKCRSRTVSNTKEIEIIDGQWTPAKLVVVLEMKRPLFNFVVSRSVLNMPLKTFLIKALNI